MKYKHFKTIEESTKYYANLFRRNKKFVAILVEWRHFFGIESNSDKDEGLAFLIAEVHKKHLLRWETQLERIKNNAKKYGSNYLTYLGLEVTKHYLEAQRRAIGGKVEKDKEVYLRNIEWTKKRVGVFSASLQENKAVYWGGVPDEFLPQWWLVAHPDYSLFENEYIKPEMERLKALEEEEESAKYRAAVVLEETLRIGCYHSMYKKVETKLHDLIILIKEEMKMRMESFRSGDARELKKTNLNLVALLKRQEKIVLCLDSMREEIDGSVLDPRKKKKN